jgi:hypothetical protein
MYGSVGSENIFLIHTCISSKCTVLHIFQSQQGSARRWAVLAPARGGERVGEDFAPPAH